MVVLHLQGWMIGFSDFCEIRRDLFSLGLKVTSQVATHRVNPKRSVFKQIAAAMGIINDNEETTIVSENANI